MRDAALYLRVLLELGVPVLELEGVPAVIVGEGT